jgi:hypothetical protein
MRPTVTQRRQKPDRVRLKTRLSDPQRGLSMKNTNAAVRILTFCFCLETATGLALAAAPTFVIVILLGLETPDEMLPVARVAGIALIALGLACRPARPRAEDVPSAYWAMLAYNILTAAYLAYLGAGEGLDGMLLWPVAAGHAALAGVLIYVWRSAPQAGS